MMKTQQFYETKKLKNALSKIFPDLTGFAAV
jgi:hypothetical protein